MSLHRHRVRSASNWVPTASMSSRKTGRPLIPTDTSSTGCVESVPACDRPSGERGAASRPRPSQTSAATAAVHPTRADRPRASARALTPLTIARGMRRRRLRGDVMGVSPSQAGSPHPGRVAPATRYPVDDDLAELPRRPDRRSMRATRKPLRQPLPRAAPRRAHDAPQRLGRSRRASLAIRGGLPEDEADLLKQLDHSRAVERSELNTMSNCMPSSISLM